MNKGGIPGRRQFAEPRSLEHMTLSEIEERGLAHRVAPSAVKKNKNGRPKEKLDKRNQFSLTYWFRLIQKDFKKLRPVQRSRIALDCWKTLINKSHSIPSDPEDSKVNANDMMETLKGLEVGLESAPSGTELMKEADKSELTGLEGKTIETKSESVADDEREKVMVRPNPTTPPTVQPLKAMPWPPAGPQTDESSTIQ